MAMLNNQRVHYQFPVLPCIKISCTQSPLRHLKTDICGMTIAVNGGAWPQYLLPHSKTLQKGLYVVLATRIIWLFAGVSEEAHAKPTSCSTKLMPSSAYGSFNISSHQLPGGLWALGQTLFPWRFDAVTAKLILPCPAMPCHALPCPACRHKNQFGIAGLCSVKRKPCKRLMLHEEWVPFCVPTTPTTATRPPSGCMVKSTDGHTINAYIIYTTLYIYICIYIYILYILHYIYINCQTDFFTTTAVTRLCLQPSLSMLKNSLIMQMAQPCPTKNPLHGTYSSRLLGSHCAEIGSPGHFYYCILHLPYQSIQWIYSNVGIAMP